MRTLAYAHGLSVPATCQTANAPQDTLVEITGDETVAKAGANAFNIGRLVIKSVAANSDVTVETRFREVAEIKFAAALTAGTKIKLAAVDGTTGENRADAYVEGTDAASRWAGIVWKGAGNGGVGKVLLF
jgi:hypothetical protein